MKTENKQYSGLHNELFNVMQEDWISLNDKFPKHGQRIYILWNNGVSTENIWSNKDREIVTDRSLKFYATHWKSKL